MTTVIANVRKEKKDSYAMLTTRMVMMMVVVIHTVVLVQFLFPEDRVRERTFVCIGIQFFPSFYLQNVLLLCDH